MFDLEETEKEIMNLFALITAIKAIAESLESDEHSESILNLSDIIKDKLSSVWKNVSEVENKTFTTAEMISFLITDESVPDEISDALGDALADLDVQPVDNSAEYIAGILERAQR